jgi:hypothetical protein
LDYVVQGYRDYADNGFAVKGMLVAMRNWPSGQVSNWRARYGWRAAKK